MTGPSFAQFMGARDQGTPAHYRTEQEEFNTYPAWSEYQGPAPSPNPMSNNSGKITCPTCHGDGYDLQEGNDCRACGGDGEITPTSTAREPEVYRHQYPSTQTKVPFMGSLEIGAACPACGGGTIVRASSKRGQALWACAGACDRVLANLDADPLVNPYGARQTARLAHTAKTGTRAATARVMPMLASVHASNPGLSVPEALSLVLATVSRYPEGR